MPLGMFCVWVVALGTASETRWACVQAAKARIKQRLMFLRIMGRLVKRVLHYYIILF